jgi:hypothetical protein
LDIVSSNAMVNTSTSWSTLVKERFNRAGRCQMFSLAARR